MFAIQVRESGGPEVLHYVELPDPVPAEGQVLVRAHAIGVGKPDVLFRTGVYRWRPPLPAVPGIEMTGTIEALGPGVHELRVGQKVLVYNLGAGCYAELVAAPAMSITPLPSTVDLDAAVSIPNYQVAWALINEAARGVRVHWVYVNGAAGGVGSAVIQICRANRINVIAGASSAAKCAFAQSLGADFTVDYSTENVVEKVMGFTRGRGVDLSLDHIIGKHFTDSLKMVAPFGMIVSFNALGGFPEKDLFKEMRGNLERSPAVRCFTMHSYDKDPEGRRRVATETMKLFAMDVVDPPIYQRLPLKEARRAHEMLDAREVLGKLVLKP